MALGGILTQQGATCFTTGYTNGHNHKAREAMAGASLR